MNTLLLEALKGQNKSRPPVWLMRQAGRYMPSYRALRNKYSFLELCHHPELITQVTLLPIQEFGMDAAIVFSDILMVPEAMGMQVQFEENVGPLIANSIHSPQDLCQISYSLPLEKMEYLTKAIQALKSSLNVPLIGFTGAPFTLASYWIEGKTSRDLKKTKIFAYTMPEHFQTVLSRLEKGVIQALECQLKAGCDVLQIFDSWAHVLSEEQFKIFCIEPLKRISKALQKYNKPLIYFCRGSSFRSPFIAEIPSMALSCDWMVPLHKIRAKHSTLPLQGNLDPEALFLPLGKLKEEIASLLDSMAKDPAFIFNLGHGILPDTPYIAVQELINLIKTK